MTVSLGDLPPLSSGLLEAAIKLVSKALECAELRERMDGVTVIAGKLITAIGAYISEAKREEGRKIFNGPVIINVINYTGPPLPDMDGGRDPCPDEELNATISRCQIWAQTFFYEWLSDAPSEFIQGLLDNASNAFIRITPAEERDELHIRAVVGSQVLVGFCS